MDEGSEDEGEEVGEDVLSGSAAAGDKMLGLKDSIPAKTYSF